MPVRRFMVTLREGQRIVATDRVHACDIQAIAICNAEHYGKTRDHFLRMVDMEPLDDEFSEMEPPQNPITHEQRRDQLSAILTMKRRSLGLG